MELVMLGVVYKISPKSLKVACTRGDIKKKIKERRVL